MDSVNSGYVTVSVPMHVGCNVAPWSVVNVGSAYLNSKCFLIDSVVRTAVLLQDMSTNVF